MGYQENYLPAEQQKLGHDVTILTTDSSYQKSNEIADFDCYDPGTYNYNGVETHRLRSWVHDDIGNALLFGLQAKLQSIDPDVIHLHDLLDYKTVQVLRHLRTIDAQLFVDIHIDNDNISLQKLHTTLGFLVFKQLIMPRVTSAAALFLPVNQSGKLFLRDQLGVPQEQIELLPLGIEPHFNLVTDVRDEYRNRIGATPEDVVILDSGKFEPKKDTDVLVKAVGRLQNKYKNLRLLLIGDGNESYMRQIEKLAAKYGISDRMHVTGWVNHEEVPYYYTAGDLAVMPGKLSSGRDVLGVGLPLFVADAPATEFYVKNGNGKSFQRGNVEDLISVLEPCVRDPSRREEARVNSREFVKTELSWQRIAEKSIKLYRSHGGIKG